MKKFQNFKIVFYKNKIYKKKIKKKLKIKNKLLNKKQKEYKL